MKKSGILFFVVIALMGCSDDKSNLKEGWTTEQVAAERSKCSEAQQRNFGDTEEVANKICVCYIDGVSQKLTYSVFTSKDKNFETTNTQTEIMNECLKGI